MRTRIRIAISSLLLGVVLIITTSQSALAYSPNPSKIPGECVWWAWERWPQENGPLPKGSDFGMTGSAYQWIWLAQHSGFPTGSVPRVGAIAVWGQWAAGAKSDGHVAYVETVSADGRFLVSEYNWDIFHQKDLRWVTPQAGINYVYPKGSSTVPADIHEYDRIKGSGAETYLVESGKKRYINTPDTLAYLNQRFGGDVKTVTDAVLGSYPTGRIVPLRSWSYTHNNQLITDTSNNQTFVMKDGTKRYLISYTQIDPDDSDIYYMSDAIPISHSQAAAIPTGGPIYNDGMLFVKENGAAYVIEKNMKRYIPNPDTFNDRGYGWTSLIHLPDEWIDLIPSGRIVPDVHWPIIHDDRILQGSQNQTFVMKGEKRHYLCSWEQRDPKDGSFFYPSDLKLIADSDLNAIPIGAPIVNEGQLLAPPSPSTAYVIEHNKKRAIPNPDTFTGRGYKWENVGILPKDWVDQIPTGRMVPDVHWPNTHDGILLQENGSPDVWVMRNGERSLIYSWNMVDPFDGDWYYSSDIRQVTSLATIPMAQLELPLSLARGEVYWQSYADYLSRRLSVTYQISNPGSNGAFEAAITSASGDRGVTVATTMPLLIGDILPGETKDVALAYNVPSGVSWFRTTLTASAKDANRNTHVYP